MKTIAILAVLSLLAACGGEYVPTPEELSTSEFSRGKPPKDPAPPPPYYHPSTEVCDPFCGPGETCYQETCVPCLVPPFCPLACCAEGTVLLQCWGTSAVCVPSA